jgi:hypothetical protein
MSIPKTLFGETRQVPETEEEDWGPEVTEQLSGTIDGTDNLACLSGANVFPRRRAAASTLAAGATLTPTKPVHRVQGTPGVVTLSAVTAITDGAEDGQEVRLVGDHAASFVTVPDGANTALNGPVTLELGESLDLAWDAAASVWRETGRSN